MGKNNVEKEDKGLKEYGIIFISGCINDATSESVCKEIIEYNIKREVDCVFRFIRHDVTILSGTLFRDEAAHCKICTGCRIGCDQHRLIESPFNSILWALWRSRSMMASAIVGSSNTEYH